VPQSDVGTSVKFKRHSRYKSIVTSGCVIGKINGKEISAIYNRSVEKIELWDFCPTVKPSFGQNFVSDFREIEVK